MPALPDLVAELDLRIAAAYRDLGAARARFCDAPGRAVVTACQAAEGLLNGLLDARFALTHAPAEAIDVGSVGLAVGAV